MSIWRKTLATTAFSPQPVAKMHALADDTDARIDRLP